MPLVLNLKYCRPILIFFFKTNSDDESIFSLNDIFNILLLYENVHTRMFPLVCDTDGLVSVVYDVRCGVRACVGGCQRPRQKCLFVCYRSRRSWGVAWGSANTEIELLEILLYRHIPDLKIL